jgi:AAA+ superfamily predicted ATPase
MSTQSKYIPILLIALLCAPATTTPYFNRISHGIRELVYDPEFIYRMRELGLIPKENTVSFSEIISDLSQAHRMALDDIARKLRTGKITMEVAQQQSGDILYKIGSGFSTFVSEFTAKMLPNIGKIAAILVSSYGGVIGFRILKAYLIMYMNQPQLIRQVQQPHQITQTLDNLHFTQKLKSKLTYVIDMAKNVVQNPSRAKFENIMLWGDPGTGKTAFAEIIAKEAGMTLFKTSGGDFAKLKGKDLEQIDAMFKRARENREYLFFRKRVVIFIDEMEELFGSRARANLSEDARNVLTKLLVEMSSPNSDILFIGATNRPEDMDEAMFRRMPQQIEVGLPDCKGRKAIFELYIQKLFLNDTTFNDADRALIRRLFSNALLEELASMVGDVAPAEIEDTMIRIKNRSLIYNKGIPTKKIIDETIKDKISQLKKRTNGFIRSSTKKAHKAAQQQAIAASA